LAGRRLLPYSVWWAISFNFETLARAAVGGGVAPRTGRNMNSDAKLQILIEALAAAGASALAIDGHGHVAISTMDDVALEQDVAAFVAERLGRVGDGTRLVMGHAGGRLSLTVRPVAKEYGALWVAVVREVHGVAAHAGIEWLNADEVEARYEARRVRHCRGCRCGRWPRLRKLCPRRAPHVGGRAGCWPGGDCKTPLSGWALCRRTLCVRGT
ncbi:MAG: hypothetical protein ACLTXI_12685, partial [Collinsella sp.]